MGKHGGNHPIPGYYKVQGGEVEDRDAARMSKQALVRETARLKRRAGRKSAMGAAPKAQRTKEPPKRGAVPSSTVLAAAHDREFAKMNERQRAPKRVKPVARNVHEPRYLGQAARGLFWRVARYAMAPVYLARAVVDRFRDRD